MPPEIKMMGVACEGGKWNVEGRTVMGTLSPTCRVAIHVEHTPCLSNSSGVTS